MANPALQSAYSRRGLIAVAGALLCLALTPPANAADVVVVMRPPPMRYEPLPPVPPGPKRSWTWLPGHWVWNGRGYVWIPGYYVRRPQHYVGWAPGRWVPRRGGWVWVDGYWRR